MSSKSKSGFSDSPASRPRPLTPRGAKLSRAATKSDAESPSLLPNPRALVERSARTVTANKSSVVRPIARVSTSPDIPQSKILKPSELHAQLTTALDELSKANERLLLVEKEKAEALNELEEVRKWADEAAQKRQESLISQKQEDVNSETEKLLSEQSGIEAEVFRKKEEEWQKTIQEMRSEHAVDLAALLSTNQELERVRQELAMVTGVKNQALHHADEATKIAEIHAEKMEIMSGELVRLRALLDSSVEAEAIERKNVAELKSELDFLKVKIVEKEESFAQMKLELESFKQEKNPCQKEESFEQVKLELKSLKEELEKAKVFEEKLSQRESELELLKHELERAKGFEGQTLTKKEESSENLDSELESLTQELERAKGFEEKLLQREESYQQLKSKSEFLEEELQRAKGFVENVAQKEYLEQEFEKARCLEEKLSRMDESCQQLKSKSEFLEQELEKAKGFEDNLAQKEECLRQTVSVLESLKQELEEAKVAFDEKLSQKEESYQQLQLESELLKRELEKTKDFEENLAQKEEFLQKMMLESESLKQELEKAKVVFEEQLSQQEESYQQLKLKSETLEQELEKAKDDFEENLARKEECLQQMILGSESVKQELENAKFVFDEKLSQQEESCQQMKFNSKLLEQELEKVKDDFEQNLAKKDEGLQQMMVELESLKEELEKAKGFEDKLSQREVSYQQLMSKSECLEQELEKSKIFEQSLAQKEECLQKMKSEMESVKKELDHAKNLEEKLSQSEEAYEQLILELEALVIADSYAHCLLEEWKGKFEEMELQIEKYHKSERSASESLEMVIKQLEGKNELLHEAEREIGSLKEKVLHLEASLAIQKEDLAKSEQQALENEKLATSSIKELSEQKSKLVSEIEVLRDDEEKRKKAMESLASAMDEVSTEAREAKEKLLMSQAEHEALQKQIEELKLTLKATSEKYESLLDNAKCEIERLTGSIHQSKSQSENQIEDMRLALKETNEKYEALHNDAKREIDQLRDTNERQSADHKNDKSEWEQKEEHLVKCLKTAEDENRALKSGVEKHEIMLADAKRDIDHLSRIIEQYKSEWQQKEAEFLSSVKRFEEEKMSEKANDEKKYGSMLDDAKDEIKHLSNLIEKSKMEYENSIVEWEEKEIKLLNSVKRSEEEKSSMEKEIMRLVNLLGEMEEKARFAKEEGSQLRNTLKDAITESTLLREALEESKALDYENLQDSKVLEGTRSRKQSKENGSITDGDREFEFPDENGHAHQSESNLAKEKGGSSVGDSEFKMWESWKSDEAGFSMEREHEPYDDDGLDSKVESFDQRNSMQSDSNRISPLNSQSQQLKKKKPLYRKFGNLLKMGIGNGGIPK